MCFLMDARTVPHVHRFEVIQEDPRRPGTSLSTLSGTDCTIPVAADGAESVPHTDPTKSRAECHLAALQCERRQKAHVLRLRGPFPKGNPKGRRAHDLPADRITRVQVLDPYSYI